MALQPSGTPLSMGQANTEIGNAPGTALSFSDAKFRTMLAVPSGQISLSTGYGKTYGFIFNPVLASNVNNYNLKAAAIAAGWDQVLPLKAIVTINSGVTVGSTSTGTYSFDTGVTFPAGTTLALINNGNIYGAGGAAAVNSSGGAGGPALRAQAALSVTNNGVIGGGGGAGGHGGGYYVTAYTTYNPAVAPTPYVAGTPAYWSGSSTAYGAGSGAGGGAGIVNGAGAAGYPHSSPGASSPAGAGSNGSATAGGTGGGAGYAYTYANGYYIYGGVGGNGGALGAAGGGGTGASGSGGSYPLIGAGVWYGAGSGGAGGACTNGNANITWLTTGSRFGALG